MCLNVFIFHFYILPFFREDNLFFLKINVCLYKLYVFSIFFIFIFSISSFIYFYFLIYIFSFLLFNFIIYIYIYFYFLKCFPYFRGNSLNSRADLEFKEFRLFSTMIFQKKTWKSMFFFKHPNVFFFFHDDFSKKNAEFHFFLKNHRGQKSKFLKFKVSPWS